MRFKQLIPYFRYFLNSFSYLTVYKINFSQNITRNMHHMSDNDINMNNNKKTNKKLLTWINRFNQKYNIRSAFIKTFSLSIYFIDE